MAIGIFNFGGVFVEWETSEKQGDHYLTTTIKCADHPENIPEKIVHGYKVQITERTAEELEKQFSVHKMLVPPAG